MSILSKITKVKSDPLDILLFGLGLRLSQLAKSDDSKFTDLLANRNFTIQLGSEAEGNARYYSVNNGKFSQHMGPAEKPSLTITFKDAMTGVKLLTKADATAFMLGIQNGELKMSGDYSLLMWFNQVSKFIVPKVPESLQPVVEQAKPLLEKAMPIAKELFVKASSLLGSVSGNDSAKGSKYFNEENTKDTAKSSEETNDKSSTLNTLKEKAEDKIDDLKETASDKIAELKDKASDLKDAASEKLDEAKDKAAGLKDTASDKIDEVKDKAADLKDAASDKLDDAKDKAADLKDAASDKIDEAKDKAADLKDTASDKLDEVKDKAADLKDAASDKLDEAKDKVGDLKDAAQDKATDLKENASEKLDEAKDKAGDLKDTASEKLDEAKDKAGDLKDTASDKLYEAKDKAADLKDAASDKLGEVKDNASNTTDKEKTQKDTNTTSGFASFSKEIDDEFDTTPAPHGDVKEELTIKGMSDTFTEKGEALTTTPNNSKNDTAQPVNNSLKNQTTNTSTTNTSSGFADFSKEVDDEFDTTPAPHGDVKEELTIKGMSDTFTEKGQSVNNSNDKTNKKK